VADARLAEQARPSYEELIELIRRCTVAHADETGWRIGTLSAWLWVFTNRQVTVYPIQESRGHDVVVEILGQECAGILVADCCVAYNHPELAEWLKQKCLGHLLKELSQMEGEQTRGAVRFAQEVMAMRRAALGLRDQNPKLSPEAFAEQAAAIEQRVDRLIDEKRPLTDPDNVRMAARLRQQREHVLRFLYVDGLDATNNQAERMLRPAVLTRKTSGCNRTEAETHSILASILVTCRQRAISAVEVLVKVPRATDGAIPSLIPAPQLGTS
jgi:transposase